jgi:hypothetical protein
LKHRVQGATQYSARHQLPAGARSTRLQIGYCRQECGVRNQCCQEQGFHGIKCSSSCFPELWARKELQLQKQLVWECWSLKFEVWSWWWRIKRFERISSCAWFRVTLRAHLVSCFMRIPCCCVQVQSHTSWLTLSWFENCRNYTLLVNYVVLIYQVKYFLPHPRIQESHVMG